MAPTPSRLRLRRSASVLLALAVLVLTVVFVKDLLQSRRTFVTDAETHLRRTQAKLETASRVVTAADRLTQRMGSPNSPVRKTVQSIGQGVIQKLQTEKNVASVDVALARKVAAADHCVQEFNDFSQASEAIAVLYLSGIENGVIRPHSRRWIEGDQSPYELMVPHDLTVTAMAALHNTKIRELKRFSDASRGIKAMWKLENRGIHACVRPLNTPGQGDPTQRVHVLYVQRTDEETASSLLESSTSANDDKF